MQLVVQCCPFFLYWETTWKPIWDLFKNCGESQSSNVTYLGLFLNLTCLNMDTVLPWVFRFFGILQEKWILVQEPVFYGGNCIIFVVKVIFFFFFPFGGMLVFVKAIVSLQHQAFQTIGFITLRFELSVILDQRMITIMWRKGLLTFSLYNMLFSSEIYSRR